MRNKQISNKTLILSGVALLTGLAFGSTGAHADASKSSGLTSYLSECKFMPTVLALMNPPVKNESVCIDMPVGLDEPKIVYNLNAQVVDASGRPVALSNMYMLGTALLARIKAGKLDPRHASMVGVMHGGGLDWALNPDDNTKALIENIYKLKNAGLDINLEACGVAMQVKGKKNADLYQSQNGKIHVNQGGVGRIVDLQRHGYAYLQWSK